MRGAISVNGKNVEYLLRKSTRAKRMRLSVFSDGRVVVTIPKRFPQSLVSIFLEKKIEWIGKHLSRFFLSGTSKPVISDKREYFAHKKQALLLAEERLHHFNDFYGFSWKRIGIRDQKTRWGSCSKKGNLNFNYRIAMLPPHLADYIIVHELCHLGAFDHSRDFWGLVARTIPAHRELRQELRTYAVQKFLS